MSKKRANIHPGLIGELFTDGTDYYKLIDCQSEPSATIERIRDVGITITKPISEFASLVLMKPIKPIVKPPAPRKVRADAGKPRERKPKVEQASPPAEVKSEPTPAQIDAEKVSPQLLGGGTDSIIVPAGEGKYTDYSVNNIKQVSTPPGEPVPSIKGKGKLKRGEVPLRSNPETADKKGDNLTIHVPTGLKGDTEYKVIIAGSEAMGPTLRLTVLAALEEWSGKIPKELSDYERRTVQGILDAGE